MKKEWLTEPDHEDFHVQVGGKKVCCTIHRNQMKVWCGYVAVKPGHPLYGKSYDEADLSVHGGLTYAANRTPDHKPDGDWWFGFDCGHGGDYLPGMESVMEKFPEIAHTFGRVDTYKNQAYAKAECKDLAEQLAKVS